VARRQKVETGDVSIEAKVDLRTTEDRAFEVAAHLDVTLPGIEDPRRRSSWSPPPTRCAVLAGHTRQHRRRADRQRQPVGD
jgi:hypothetical protein